MAKYVKVGFTSTTYHKEIVRKLKSQIAVMKTLDHRIDELRMAAAVHHTLILQDLDTREREMHFENHPIVIDDTLPIDCIIIGCDMDGIDRAIERIK